MSTPDLWKRYQQYLCGVPALGLTLDVSRMRIEDDFLERMALPLRQAFEAMGDLERGGVANPDEQRMVGHYWLRAPDRAPAPAIAGQIRKTVTDVKAFAAAVHNDTIRTPAGLRFTRVLCVGIGGSALGPMFVADALGNPGGDRMEVHFIDNTDPDGIARTLRGLAGQLRETLCVVTSKSGGTPDTRNGMLLVAEAYRQAGLDFPRQAVAVTQPGSRLDRDAAGQGWLARFPMFDWVGGRTSELSAVGLVPAALQGLDIDGLMQSEKPPGRLGLPEEFGRCEVTGRRLLLDELERSAVSNKLVDRDLLRRSARSRKPALASELVTCEDSGAMLLPSEVARCSVTGKMVDAGLLFKSELSGRVALHHLFQRCALTQSLVLKEELEQCHLTGKLVIPSEMETCAVTNVKALRQRMVFCEPPGAWVLPSEVGRSDYSGKPVPRSLLIRSDKPPKRHGIPDEFRRCELTGRRLLLDELGCSAVSHKVVDRDLLYPSGNSGQLALVSELVTCEESGIKLLPTEVARCSVTEKTVDSRLLATSELSGRAALSRFMQKCASTGKLVLSAELERCGLTGKLVLASELEVCAVTGLRGIRGEMVWSNGAGKYLVPYDTLELTLLTALSGGRPNPNTYQAIRWSGVAVEVFEAKVMKLRTRISAAMDSVATRSESPRCQSLRALLLRTQGRSWEAARVAAHLMKTDPGEGRRIILAVASDLEEGTAGHLPLPLEAARMRNQLLGQPWPRDYRCTAWSGRASTWGSTRSRTCATCCRRCSPWATARTRKRWATGCRMRGRSGSGSKVHRRRWACPPSHSVDSWSTSSGPGIPSDPRAATAFGRHSTRQETPFTGRVQKYPLLPLAQVP
jgi:hypothetical protein